MLRPPESYIFRYQQYHQILDVDPSVVIYIHQQWYLVGSDFDQQVFHFASRYYWYSGRTYLTFVLQ